ncbi:MAG: hypothetical protein ABR567_21940 [Myxococcales bacterium]|nr:hypothetical protein [Myxococcales bacterium]
MHRMIFTVDTWIAGAFGVVLVAAPQVLFTLYGMQGDASSDFLARLLGAFVLGQAPLLWWTRDHVATPQGIAITRAHGIVDTISTALCAAACLRGIMNPGGWVVVALFVLFGSGRIYYGFIARPAMATAA